jgi:acetyl esterase/lipase
MPSLQSYLFRLYLNYFKATVNWDTPVPKLRALMENNTRWNRPPKGVAIKPVMAGGVPAEWLEPAGADPGQVMLYLHGGGYVIGSCNTHRAMVARLAQAGGLRALLLEYRLAPEHPFPAALEDAAAAYRWLLEQGIASQQIVIAGDSAGGGLTLATLLALRDAGDPLPAAAVCLSPLTDLACTGESIQTRAKADPWLTPATALLARYYQGDHDPRSPLLSPLYGDLRGLPPLLIHVGSDEILLSDSTRLAERAQAAEVEVTLEIWPDMWHVWHIFTPYLPEAQRAIAAIGAFVRSRQRLGQRVSAPATA